MTSATDPARSAEQRGDTAEVGGTDTGHAPVPRPPRRWWRTRRGLVWLSAAAVLVAGTVVVTLVTRGPGPDDVVREYLTAIRQGDVDKALKVAGTSRPAGEQARFLAADALSDDWRIVEVETTSDHVRENGTGWAQVDVTIAGPDGETIDGGINLSRENGRWRLDEPLITAHLAPMQLSYLDVNGLITPATRSVRYLMLPGVYRVYRTASDLVAVKPMTAMLLQRWNVAESYTPLRPAAVSLTRKGEDAARKAITTRIDECAKRTELSLGDCPFGSGSDRVSTPDGRRFEHVADVRWKVLRHPEVGFVDEGARIRTVLTAPGAVELSGTGVPTSGGTRVAFTTTCNIGASPGDGWTVTLTRPDSLEIQRREHTNRYTC